MLPENTYTLLYTFKKESIVSDKDNLLKFPKEKTKQKFKSRDRDRTRGARSQGNQPGGKREDRHRQLPSNTTHPYREQRAMSMSDR